MNTVKNQALVQALDSRILTLIELKKQFLNDEYLVLYFGKLYLDCY